MGVMFVGGWYLQSSLMEKQYHNMEQVDQLNKKINQQNDKISELHVIIETLLREDGKVCTLMCVVLMFCSTLIHL